MKLSRNLTSPLNWILDNLVPPFVRDSKFFSRPMLWLLFGKKTRLFMEFKERAFSLTSEEMVDYYRNLAGVHIKRETDLNEESIRFIMDNLSGNTVLDIACGRGYLARKIAAEKGLQVTGIDFIVPEDLRHSANPVFMEGNLEQIPFPDRHFDTVICTHTLEHLKDVSQGVQELRRVCRERLIVVVPRQREYKYTFDLHLHFFPYEFSVRKVFGNEIGRCRCINNDWVYVEEPVTKYI